MQEIKGLELYVLTPLSAIFQLHLFNNLKIATMYHIIYRNRSLKFKLIDDLTFIYA